MSLSLLLPLGLAALAALVVPLVVHLIRQPPHDVIDFAALRWLGERTLPRRRLRFDDLVLLCVRLLLVASVAVLLAMPVLDRDPRAARDRIAVVPGVDATALRASGSAGDTVWLAPGFPSVETPPPPASASMSSLVRELDAALAPAAKLHLVVPRTLDGLDGERIAVQRALEWQVVDTPVAAPDAAARSTATRTLAVRVAPEQAASARPLRAALAAWQTLEPDRWTLDEAGPDAGLPEPGAWLAWLLPELTPGVRAWIEGGGRALVIGGDEEAAGSPAWRDADGTVLARRRAFGRGELVTLARPLDPARLPALLDAQFPQRLRGLFEDAAPAPARAFSADAAPRDGAAASTPPRFALDAWLILALVALFAIERVLATRRRNAA